MSAYEDNCFRELLANSGLVEETTPIVHNGRQVTVETGLGESFRADLRKRAAKALGIPAELGFAGEFDMSMSQELAELVTTYTMSKVLEPQGEVRLGTKMAITGAGLIALSSIDKPGLYEPMVLDTKLNLYGTLLVAGVEVYPFVDPDLIERGQVTDYTELEVCKGVIAVLDRVEIHDATTGFVCAGGFSQARVPVAVDELIFHRIPVEQVNR